MRDLLIGADGDLVVTNSKLQTVDGGPAIAQAIRQRLQFFRGEWFLDLDAGVPYFQEVLGTKLAPAVLQAVFRTAIAETPGVSSVTRLALTYDGAGRKLAVDIGVETDAGLLEVTI
jgi:hypothetical protein